MNPFQFALWAIAFVGLLVGIIAGVGTFEGVDPAAQASFSGAASGLGALALIGGLVAAAVTWRPPTGA